MSRHTGTGRSGTASRKIVAQVAANERWAKTSDREAATAPARRAFLDRFLVQVDPLGELPEDERARRADSALRAHMARLRLKSVTKRRNASPSRDTDSLGAVTGDE